MLFLLLEIVYFVMAISVFTTIAFGFFTQCNKPEYTLGWYVSFFIFAVFASVFWPVTLLDKYFCEHEATQQ